MKVTSTLLAAAGLMVAISGAAQATVIFTSGNNPQQPGEENVLFGNPQTGTTITGATNHSNTAVQFTSTQTLATGGIGQAFLEAVAPATVITGTVTFSVPGDTFTDYIFNPQVGGPDATGGSAIITAISNDGTFTKNIILGNGNNFWTLTTAGGEVISSVSLSLASGTSYDQYKQPRVSGISPISPGPQPPPPSVPEPVSLVLLGSALVGFGLLRRRKA